MEPPMHKMKQSDLLKGMTSSLREGACWGLTARWLRECISDGPAVAGLAMLTGTTAHEAIIKHSQHGNQFLGGANEDASIGNCMVMMNGLDAQPHQITNTGGYINTAVSIIAAMGGGTFNGLLVFSCPQGRHAMGVSNTRNVWSLFDPNFGTWMFAGDNRGAPTRFSQLLVDNFTHYKVQEVKLYTASKLF